MIPVPAPGTDLNIESLRRLEHDDFTGIAASVVQLTQNPQDNYLLVFKNGLYLHNLGGAEWSVLGTTLTFAVALIVAVCRMSKEERP